MGRFRWALLTLLAAGLGLAIRGGASRATASLPSGEESRMVRASGDAAASSPAPVLVPPEENALPIGMTPEEELIKDQIGTYTRDTAPPPGPGIRQCAEWEPVTGALVRYSFGLPYTVLREIASDIELWVLVASSTEQATCASLLQSNGVNMAHVHFVIAATNSIWTRDYGPQFAFDANGDQGIIDHHYNRPRPQDDQVNYIVGPAWDVPVYGSPLIHTGGNFMCDGHDNGFSTDLVYNENPGLTHAQVDAYMQSYLGINTYHVIQDVDVSGIHHIDCWGKLLNEETFLVKQVSPGNSEYTRLEQNVATIRTWTDCYGRPYKIVRVMCQNIGSGGVASYTNSVILDKKVLVPTFGDSAGDARALQTYRDAMPGYEVLGFTGSWLSDDAIHCRAMGIHDKYMLRVDLAPLPDTVQTTGTGEVRLEVNIDDRSEAGLKSDSLLVYWRTAGQLDFQALHMAASAGPDSFYADIPAQPQGTRVEYYAFAADQSNRRERRPYVAPAGYYSYVVGLGPASVAAGSASSLELASSWPNPFPGGTTINFRLPATGPARLEVVDIQGRRVATLSGGLLSAGGHSAYWDGRDAAGNDMPNGIYLFRLSAGDQVLVRRGVLLRR
jgi:agmatine deiminase